MPLPTTVITLTPPTLPVNYCPTGYQALANDIIGQAAAQFNSTVGNSFFNTGSSAPSADNRIYPWLDNDGNWWVWSNAYTAWIRKNPVDPGSAERRIWLGNTTDLLSYDGGDGTSTVYQAAGPMWQVDIAMQAVFPVGVGTFANSGIVSVGALTTNTGVAGEDKHTLIASEIPKHTHTIENQGAEKAQRGSADFLAATNLASPESSIDLKPTNSFGGDASGNTVAHNNLPPFVGVYFIQRTARVYYTK